MIDKTEKMNKELYKELLIDLMDPIILETKKGPVKFPVSGARCNAFICAWCGKTPYKDPLDYEVEEIPIILYLQEGHRGSIEFHDKCFIEVIGLD